MSGVTKNDVELRHCPDPCGDIGDSVSFFLPTYAHVDKFREKWEYGFKNIPGALNFHFAKRWHHIPVFSGGLIQSQQLLERTISLPINYYMPKMNDMISKLEELL